MFVFQSLRDLDYVVKDKTLLESIMDTEFFDATEKGIFYKGLHRWCPVLPTAFAILFAALSAEALSAIVCVCVRERENTKS